MTTYVRTGGGMVFTFLKARGLNVGSSLVENDKVPYAYMLLVDEALLQVTSKAVTSHK